MIEIGDMYQLNGTALKVQITYVFTDCVYCKNLNGPRTNHIESLGIDIIKELYTKLEKIYD